MEDDRMDEAQEELIKLDDRDKVEFGAFFDKLKKSSLRNRFYHLDLEQNKLIANSHRCTKHRIYPLSLINDVQAGCCSIDLKHYREKRAKLSLKKKKPLEDLENLAMVISYNNYKDSLELIAIDQVERDRWVHVLNFYVRQAHKKPLNPTEDANKKFDTVDKSSNKKLDKNELSRFVGSLNYKIKKDTLKTLMKSCDLDNDGQLDEEEFALFMDNLTKRHEIISLFKMVTSKQGHHKSDQLPEHMTLKEFQHFLATFQNEPKSESECKELIEKYEPSESSSKHMFTFYGFLNYLNDPEQHIANPEHLTTVYNDMNQKFPSYFINSSHNTYLSGDQVTSTASADCYKMALMRGARLVEMDCYDGADGQPRVYHGGTLSNKILFEDIILIIKDYAFTTSQYPLILTIELHCSGAQQRVMADILKKHLLEFLYTDAFDPDNYPTLEELKFKILIRCQKPKMQPTISKLSKMTSMSTLDEDDDDPEEDEKKKVKSFQEIVELSDLVNCMQNAKFQGLDYAHINYKTNHVSSISEKKCKKVIAQETPERLIRYTSRFAAKIYPAFYRQLSSNLEALDYWRYGFQIAALNFQTNDTSMKLNQALFADNGGCGYVLKPRVLRNPDLNFNPHNPETMKNKKILKLKIISGQHLPMPNSGDMVKDISDPYVSVHIHGVPADSTSQKTKTVDDNGLNPMWNQDMTFTINCPELAFVEFIVRDEDFGKDDLIGHYVIRFKNIRTGYRHLQLINKKKKGTLFVGVTIQNLA